MSAAARRNNVPSCGECKQSLMGKQYLMQVWIFILWVRLFIATSQHFLAIGAKIVLCLSCDYMSTH